MGENVQSLNPSEAVCGFAAWLTTRDEVTTMSARHSSGPIADLVKEFCEVQGLPAISKSWPGNLVSQYSPASEEPEEECADMVNHPPHYTSHPSGVECIQVTEHMNFCLGNAVKYIWRADLKGSGVEDLKKAAWYIEREIKRRESK